MLAGCSDEDVNDIVKESMPVVESIEGVEDVESQELTVEAVKLDDKDAHSCITVSQEDSMLRWTHTITEPIRNYNIYFFTLDAVQTGTLSDSCVGMYKTPEMQFDLENIRGLVVNNRLLVAIVAVGFDESVLGTSEVEVVYETIHSKTNNVADLPSIAYVGENQYKVSVTALKQSSRASFITDISEDSEIVQNIEDYTVTFAKPGEAKLRVIVEGGIGLEDFTEDFTIAVTDKTYTFVNGILTVYCEQGFSDWKEDLNIADIEKVSLAPSVDEIPESAFEGCVNLNAVCIQRQYNDVTLGARAFKDCVNLTGDGCEIYSFLRKLDYIGEEAFIGCKELSRVKFRGDSLYYIGPRAFYGCDKIEEIRFCEGCRISEVTCEVGKDAFTGLAESGIVLFTDEPAIDSLKQRYSEGGMIFDSGRWQVELINYYKNDIPPFDIEGEYLEYIPFNVQVCDSIELPDTQVHTKFICVNLQDSNNYDITEGIIIKMINNELVLCINQNMTVDYYFGRYLSDEVKLVRSGDVICKESGMLSGFMLRNDAIYRILQ